MTDKNPMDRVLEAWTDAGPHPGFHKRMQDWVRSWWPPLGNALDEACREELERKDAASDE